MTSESQDNSADVSEKSPEFSEDAKIVDADGKEVGSKNVVASTENLSEAQVTEVKEKLAANNVVINDNSIVDMLISALLIILEML